MNFATFDKLIGQTEELIRGTHELAQALQATRDEYAKLVEQVTQTFGGLPGGTTHSSQPAKKAVKATKVVKAAKAAKADKPAKTSEKSETGERQAPLRQVIFDILCRPDIKKAGARSRDIVEIIETEGLWHTDGALDTMVSGGLYALKTEGKIKRGEDKHYFHIAGEKL